MLQADAYTPEQATQYFINRDELTKKLFISLNAIYNALENCWDYLTESQRKILQPVIDLILRSLQSSNKSAVLSELSLRRKVVSLINDIVKDGSIFNAVQKEAIKPFSDGSIWKELQECIETESSFQKHYDQYPLVTLTKEEKTLKDKPILNTSEFTYTKTDDLQFEVKYIIPANQLDEAKKHGEPGATELQLHGYEPQEFVLTPMNYGNPDLDELEQKLVKDFDLTGWNYFDIDGKDPASRITVLKALLELADSKDIQVHLTPVPLIPVSSEETELEQKIQAAKARYDNRTKDKAAIQELISDFREDVIGGADEKVREESSKKIIEKLTQLAQRVVSDPNYKFNDPMNKQKFIAELRELAKQTQEIRSHKKNEKQEQLIDRTKTNTTTILKKFEEYPSDLEKKTIDELKEDNIHISNLVRTTLENITEMDQRHPETKRLKYSIQTAIADCLTKGIALVIERLDEQKNRAEKLFDEGHSDLLDGNVEHHKEILDRQNNIVECLLGLANKLPQFNNKENFIKQLNDALKRCNGQRESLDIDRARVLTIHRFNPLLNPESITIKVIKENFPSELRSDPRVADAIQLCLKSLINNPAIPEGIRSIFKEKNFHDQNVGIFSRLFTTPLTAYAAIRQLEGFYTNPAHQTPNELEAVIKNLQAVTDLTDDEVRLRKALLDKLPLVEHKIAAHEHVAAAEAAVAPVLTPVVEHAPAVSPVISVSTVTPGKKEPKVVDEKTKLAAPSITPVVESADVKKISSELEHLISHLKQLSQNIKDVANNYKGQTNASLETKLKLFQDSLKQYQAVMDGQVVDIGGKFITDENVFKQCDAVNTLFQECNSQITATGLLIRHALGNLQNNIIHFQEDVKTCNQRLGNIQILIANFSNTNNPENDAKLIAASIDEVDNLILAAQHQMSQVWDPEQNRALLEQLKKLNDNSVKTYNAANSTLDQINKTLEESKKELEDKLKGDSTLESIPIKIAAINEIQFLYKQKLAVLNALDIALVKTNIVPIQARIKSIKSEWEQLNQNYTKQWNELSQKFEELQKQKLLDEQKQEIASLKEIANDVEKIKLEISKTEEIVGDLDKVYRKKIVKDLSNVKALANEFNQNVDAQKEVLLKIRGHVNTNIAGDNLADLIYLLDQANTSVNNTQKGFGSFVYAVQAEINISKESIQNVSKHYEQAIKLYHDLQEGIKRDPLVIAAGTEFPKISQAQLDANAAIKAGDKEFSVLDNKVKQLKEYSDLQNLQKTALELQKTVNADFDTFNNKVFFWADIKNIKSEMVKLSKPELYQEPKITVEFKPGDKRINLQIEAQEIKIGSIDTKKSAYQKIAEKLDEINLKYSADLKLSGQPQTAKWPEEYKAFEQVKAFADLYLAKWQTALVEAYGNLLKTALADFNLHFKELSNSTEMTDNLSGLEKFYKENIQNKFNYIQELLAKLGIVSDDPKDIAEQLTKKIGPELSEKFMSAFTAKQELDQTYEKTHAELEAIQKKQEIAELKSVNQIRAECIKILSGIRVDALESELTENIHNIGNATDDSQLSTAIKKALQWYNDNVAIKVDGVYKLMQKIGINVDSITIKNTPMEFESSVRSKLSNDFYDQFFKPVIDSINKNDAAQRIKDAIAKGRESLKFKEADKKQVEQEIKGLTENFTELASKASRGPAVSKLYIDNEQMNAEFKPLALQYVDLNNKYKILTQNNRGINLALLNDAKIKADATYKALETKVINANVLNECEKELKDITKNVQLNSVQVASYLTNRRIKPDDEVKNLQSDIRTSVSTREEKINQLLVKLNKIDVSADVKGSLLKTVLLTRTHLQWDANNTNRALGTGVYYSGPKLQSEQSAPVVVMPEINKISIVNSDIARELREVDDYLISHPEIISITTLTAKLEELAQINFKIKNNEDKLSSFVAMKETKIDDESKSSVPKVSAAEAMSLTQLSDWSKRLRDEITPKLEKLQEKVKDEKKQLAELNIKYPNLQSSDLLALYKLNKTNELDIKNEEIELKKLLDSSKLIEEKIQSNTANSINIVQSVNLQLHNTLKENRSSFATDSDYDKFVDQQTDDALKQDQSYQKLLKENEQLSVHLNKITAIYQKRLNRNLLGYGMHEEPVKGLGDCFFDAMGQQLMEIDAKAEDKLLDLCVKHLQLLSKFSQDNKCTYKKEIIGYLRKLGNFPATDKDEDIQKVFADTNTLNIKTWFSKKIDEVRYPKEARLEPTSRMSMLLRFLTKFQALELYDYYITSKYGSPVTLRIDTPRVEAEQPDLLILCRALNHSVVLVQGAASKDPVIVYKIQGAPEKPLYLSFIEKPGHYNIARFNKDRTEAEKKAFTAEVAISSNVEYMQVPLMLDAIPKDLNFDLKTAAPIISTLTTQQQGVKTENK